MVRLLTAAVRFGTADIRDRQAFNEVMRELYPARELGYRNRAWDDAEVAQWFAGRALAQGIPPNCEADYITWTKRLGSNSRFRKNTERAPAWRLAHGAYEPHQGSSGPGPDAFIFADGRYSPCQDNVPPRIRGQSPGLSKNALFTMAHYLGLQ
jgi:hypothetical protein